MTHDVFISYSSKDKPIADGICATMEQNGVRCWIAPRDIRPGADWSGSIIHAIAESRVFVLVLSHFANASPQVKREVERAVNHGIPVIPYRIEDVQPTESLEYFISTPHWLDAFTPPVERHAQYLADTVKRILSEPPASGQASQPARAAGPASLPPRPQAKRPGWLKPLLRPAPLVGLFAALLLAAGLSAYLLRPPSFVGDWTSTRITWAPGAAAGFTRITLGELFSSAMVGPSTKTWFTVTPANAYTGRLTSVDQGSITRLGPDVVFTSTSGESARVHVSTIPIDDPQAPAIGGKEGEGGLVLQGYGGKPAESWVGRPDNTAAGGPLAGIAGAWRYETWPALPTGQVWTAQLTIAANGAYKLTLKEAEGGLWTAANGAWKKTLDTYQFSSAGAVTTGSYQFNGRNLVTITTNSHSTMWKRGS